MIAIIQKKIYAYAKRKISKYHCTYLERKISRKSALTSSFFKLVAQYFISCDSDQYVAIGYLKGLSDPKKSHTDLNAIEELLPNQKKALPDFFRRTHYAFNTEKCFGIGEVNLKGTYSKALEELRIQSVDLDYNHFLTLLLEEKPFHYLKYTHGFWDYNVQRKIKEYAVSNGKDVVMSGEASIRYNSVVENNFDGKILELVNSNEFKKMVNERDVYFCPTLSNGSVSFDLELDILKNFSEKGVLYDYSQLMLLQEFSKGKLISSANIFKKVICSNSPRNAFVSTFDQYDLVLICNHRVAASLEKIYPNFKYIYCLPDAGQDVQHFMHPLEFADDVCNAVLEKGGSKPTLILSQMSILSTFVSYILLTRYKDRRVSLIDIGKPLQTLFSPDITGGGAWRDGHNLRDHYSKLSHLMSKEMYDRLMRDTNITCESGLKFKQDMDCEYAATYRKPLF